MIVPPEGQSFSWAQLMLQAGHQVCRLVWWEWEKGPIGPTLQSCPYLEMRADTKELLRHPTEKGGSPYLYEPSMADLEATDWVHL